MTGLWVPSLQFLEEETDTLSKHLTPSCGPHHSHLGYSDSSGPVCSLNDHWHLSSQLRGGKSRSQAFSSLLAYLTGYLVLLGTEPGCSPTSLANMSLRQGQGRGGVIPSFLRCQWILPLDSPTLLITGWGWKFTDPQAHPDSQSHLIYSQTALWPTSQGPGPISACPSGELMVTHPSVSVPPLTHIHWGSLHTQQQCCKLSLP